MSAKAIVDLVIGIAVVGLVLWLGRGLIGGIQAPARLDAAIGNNAALAKGSEAQSKGVEGLKKAADDRKAKSAAAVASAGKTEAARVKAILDAKPEGTTDCERAANRIDRELGLK